MPVQAEVAHQLITLLRTHSPLLSAHVPHEFTTIIGVGHSIGSILMNQLTARYANDIDALVLTGFSKSILLPAPGVLVTAGVAPAAVVNPSHFGGESIGYLTPTSKSGFMTLFYYGDFDPAFANDDFKLVGTITIGEGATAAAAPGVQAASGFKNPVYVISGNDE